MQYLIVIGLILFSTSLYSENKIDSDIEEMKKEKEEVSKDVDEVKSLIREKKNQLKGKISPQEKRMLEDQVEKLKSLIDKYQEIIDMIERLTEITNRKMRFKELNKECIKSIVNNSWDQKKETLCTLFEKFKDEDDYQTRILHFELLNQLVNEIRKKLN